MKDVLNYRKACPACRTRSGFGYGLSSTRQMGDGSTLAVYSCQCGRRFVFDDRGRLQLPKVHLPGRFEVQERKFS